MKLNRGIFLLAIIILFSNFISASYMLSNPQTTQYNLMSNPLGTYNKAVCSQGQDFIIQISPFGCTPAVVRTDLLEESDVPIFCQLGATQVNPLIDVKAIDSISFSGKYPSQISGIGFHPAKAALGIKGDLNTPVLSNIGYVVINLRKQTNASAIPDYISGNLTAKISYNIKNAFGIGNALFYLPEFATESDFQEKKYQYSFWNGKGYLKADNIGNDEAQISVYTDTGILSDVTLKKGQTSNLIYLPGFECEAGLKLKLDSLENPNRRARLKINAEVVEVAKSEKFLENKCTVLGVKTNGITETVNIKCQEDSGANTFGLSISSKLNLKIDGNEKTVKLGERLYEAGTGKSVYLGYIGSKGNPDNPENLFIYLVAAPGPHAEKLSDDELNAINSIAELVGAQTASLGILDISTTVIKVNAGLSSALYRLIVEGKELAPIMQTDGTKIIFGKTISITGFSEAQDVELTEEAKENFDSAWQDYETIRNSFPSEIFDGEITYGEEALYKEIDLASYANQKKTADDLCKEFIQSYPDSTKNLDKYCSDYKLSNSETEKIYVTINKQIKEISLDGIYEPSFEDYGVKVLAKTPNGTQIFELRKEKTVYLKNSGTDSLQLISAEDNSARVHIRVTTPKGTKFETVQMEKDVTVTFEEGYSFTLTQINLKKLAKVSVIPNINNAGTSANFSFKIGIEKRAIDLPPEKTRKLIKSLDDTVNQWNNISSVLGKGIEVLKTSCLFTGAALVVKNFIFSEGAGIARQQVMRGTGGWYEKCAEFVGNGAYSSQDQCLMDKSDEIDKDVTELGKLIDAQNLEIQKLEETHTTQGFLTEKIVNTDEFMKDYIPKVNTYLGNAPESFFTETGKEPIDKNGILNTLTYEGYKSGQYTLEQLKKIDLNMKILNDASASPELRESAEATLYSVLSDVQATSRSYQTALSFDEQLNSKGLTGIGATDSYGDEKAIKGNYDGGTVSGSQLSGLEAGRTYPAKSITYNNKKYILILEESSKGNYFIKKVYDGETLQPLSSEQEALIKNAFSMFKQYDASSYTNKYTNAKLSYYETEPYKGMPAIVPFDLNNGWYAAVKQTLPVGSNIQTYEASGRVSSFYLCNVGQNGLEEFQTVGDDICQMINTGTGMPYNQFNGLSENEAKSLIIKAQGAIEQASKISESQRKGTVSISGQRIPVGSPAVDVPQFQCQDFMSPKDCLLMFNLCDPVICPSSRCDLGGAYPVRDVIQTGVIGSIALCLPNIQEGIIMPVCLTGIKAGIDGFLSVLTATRDCLQENLNSGKMIGICDEIYSVYMCDFLWKQALPLSNLIIPKVIESLLGQNVRGGGEYLGIANSWSAAEKSVNYFTNYYAANAKESFVKRTTEGVQGEICKSFISGVVPSGADLIDTLIQPDSPSQFTGRFDEISLSTATVPPTSHYKVFYHIFAGKDSGSYYQVYLKGIPGSSYYQDTSSTVSVASGYIAVGGYASETKDFIATSGYKELCINVNGQEECGFKEVSTSFTSNYIKDEYLKEQATKTDIKTESECISGSASVYSLLDPNMQSAAESLINPEIYNEGIIRICATDNPGKGTDANAGLENSRWVEVGYCDNEKIKCWIDTQSIENVIKTSTVENATLETLSESYLEVLRNQNGYLSEEQFSSAVQDIEAEKDATKRISAIDDIIEKVFMSNEKVQLFSLRGDAYAELFKILWSQIPKPAEKEIPKTEETPVTSEKPSEETPVVPSGPASGDRIWLVAKTLAEDGFDEKRSVADDCKSDGCIYGNVCSRFILHVLINAGVKTFLNEDKTGCITDWKKQPICIVSSDGSMNFNPVSHSGYENMNDLANLFNKNPDEWIEINSENWDKLERGDILMLGLGVEKTQHVVVFDSYSSDKTGFRGYGDPGTRKNALGITVPVKAQLEGSPSADFQKIPYPIKAAHTPPQEGDWYIYRVFRYVGDLSPEAKGELSPIIVKIEEIIVDRTTKSDIIWQQAGIIAVDCLKTSTGICSEGAGKFVSRVLTNAGISGMDVIDSPNSALILSSLIDKNEDFSEVDLNNIQSGDIILIGHGCEKKPYTMGVVSHVTDGNTEIYFYTNLEGRFNYEDGVLRSSNTGAVKDKVDLEAMPFSTEIQADRNGILSSIVNLYVYRAYRYTKDLTDEEKANIKPRTKWTLDMAIEQVSTLKGNYVDNKVFVDQLIFDGILNETNCADVRVSSRWISGKGKDMTWLKKLLLEKKAIATSATIVPEVETPIETGTSLIPSSDYVTYQSTFEKYATQNRPVKGIVMSVNEFKALLAAIANQNNWGKSTRGGSGWLMGYETGNVNYQGTDKQVATVSGILKPTIEATITDTKSIYYPCISRNPLRERLRCSLSVLHTGKVDYNGFLGTGIGANTDGNTYADSILTLWDTWKNYFSSEPGVSGGAH